MMSQRLLLEVLRRPLAKSSRSWHIWKKIGRSGADDHVEVKTGQWPA
jgi:hypothetical protein